jgi:hypothetical protein
MYAFGLENAPDRAGALYPGHFVHTEAPGLYKKTAHTQRRQGVCTTPGEESVERERMKERERATFHESIIKGRRSA